jgi:hypothetical protein
MHDIIIACFSISIAAIIVVLFVSRIQGIMRIGVVVSAIYSFFMCVRMFVPKFVMELSMLAIVVLIRAVGVIVPGIPAIIAATIATVAAIAISITAIAAVAISIAVTAAVVAAAKAEAKETLGGSRDSGSCQ